MVWGKTMHGLSQNDACFEANRSMLFFEEISAIFSEKVSEKENCRGGKGSNNPLLV